MTSGIITNRGGATLGEMQFVDNLIEGVNEAYGLEKDPGSEEASASKGIRLELYDKYIASFEDLGEFSASVWMEDDRDVCVQIYPSRYRMEFREFRRMLLRVDRVFDRVFGNICESRAEFYEGRMGHDVVLVHDSRRSGVDLIDIRLINLYKKPLWRDALVDVLKLLHERLRREQEEEEE